MAIVDADVKVILDTERDTTPFIETAQLFVDEALAGTSLSLARKNKIVLYLAAHFVWLTDTYGLISKRSADMIEEYHSRNEASPMAFTSSVFGKQALALDTSGTLAAASANNGLKARFRVFAQRQCWPSYPPYWLGG